MYESWRMMNETDEEEEEEEVKLESGKAAPQTFQNLKGASSARARAFVGVRAFERPGACVCAYN